MKRVLVVGAGGFVGQKIARAINASGVAQAVAGVRRPSPGLAAAGIETRFCDARSAATISASLDGITHIVNCVLGNPDTMLAAARNITEAAQQRKIARLVHFSSIAVYGSASGLVAEDHPLGRDVDWYGAAKVSCEAIVNATSERGLSSVILRPGLVYGPGSRLWTWRIGRLLRARRLGDLGVAGDGFCNLIHVDDVAAATVAALDVAEEGVAVYNLSDPAPPTWNHYLMDFARAIGATPVRRIPTWQMSVERKLAAPPLKIAQIVAGRLRLDDRLIPDPVTPSLIRLFCQDVRYETERANSVLRFPRTPYAAGICDAAAWFSAQ